MLPSSRISLPSLLSDDSTLSRVRWLGASPKLKLRVKLGKELDFFCFKAGFWVGFRVIPWSSWYLYDHCWFSVGVLPLSRKFEAAEVVISTLGVPLEAGAFWKLGTARVVSLAGILCGVGIVGVGKWILAVLVLASGRWACGGWKWWIDLKIKQLVITSS